ncbi:cupin domain-containing protein [Croceitalea rosinachiae]|uniref:Cupin domain-containing protein n=1 Tax=Croceitalea rosinachiae TaxID=3075596 RepID=A0ABU3A731_9FLAO|nr:cupin domain-containing protein [Croceitalea sp. F388]MDT0605715.1 cupin domain-containing protein [Croceitalea sp. F388]
MQIKVLIFACFVFLCTMVKGQVDSIIAIPLDKSVLSGVGLKKLSLKDEPEKEFYQKRLYHGDDISIYVVSTEAWNNDFRNFWLDEFVYMFHGQAVVKPQKGKVQLFNSGDYFFAPKGYTGEWEIKTGNNLHYELSVISTTRADSTLISENIEHKLFEKSVLSGVHIQLNDNGKYTEILKKGVELTVMLKAERPSKWQIEPAKEMLIQLLSGQVTIETLAGTETTFFTGDFFIVPNGLEGIWKSDGHGLIKYLTIEKTRLP